MSPGNFFFLPTIVKLWTHLLNHTVREAAFSVQWREPDVRHLQKSQAVTRGSSSTWTWAEFWLAPIPSGEYINRKRMMKIHEHISGWSSGGLPCLTLKHCHYLSCAASHLDELSGYYLHHLSHLLMIWKKKKKKTKQIIRQINKKFQPCYQEVQPPVWGLRWHGYTADHCPHSCDDRRWRCTSNDA